MASVTTARNNLSTQSQTWAIDRDARLADLERRLGLLESLGINSQLMRLSQSVGASSLSMVPFEVQIASITAGTVQTSIVMPDLDKRYDRMMVLAQGKVQMAFTTAAIRTPAISVSGYIDGSPITTLNSQPLAFQIPSQTGYTVPFNLSGFADLRPVVSPVWTYEVYTTDPTDVNFLLGNVSLWGTLIYYKESA